MPMISSSPASGMLKVESVAALTTSASLGTPKSSEKTTICRISLRAMASKIETGT